MEREFDYDILPEIKNRWSPRALASDPIAKEDVRALLEAARYAPSCFNEQPWRFILAENDETLVKMRSVLAPMNQKWANRAPLLLMILAKKTFEANGKANAWHMFDTGTAWGYLSLEAQRRGLITHAMGGFSQTMARDIYRIPEDYEIVSIVAVGKRGDEGQLDKELQERESPGLRKNISDLLI